MASVFISSATRLWPIPREQSRIHQVSLSFCTDILMFIIHLYVQYTSLHYVICIHRYISLQYIMHLYITFTSLYYTYIKHVHCTFMHINILDIHTSLCWHAYLCSNAYLCIAFLKHNMEIKSFPDGKNGGTKWLRSCDKV